MNKEEAIKRITTGTNECPIRIIKGKELRLCGFGTCPHALLPKEEVCPCHESQPPKELIEQAKKMKFENVWDSKNGFNPEFLKPKEVKI